MRLYLHSVGSVVYHASYQWREKNNITIMLILLLEWISYIPLVIKYLAMTMADLMIVWPVKNLIKMKFDRTFIPNARTPMYVNFFFWANVSELSMLVTGMLTVVVQ